MLTILFNQPTTPTEANEGTGALTAEVTTIVGVGVYATPDKTATGDLQAQETIVAGVGDYTSPLKTATGDLQAQETLIVGVGVYSTPTKTATGDLQAQATTIVGVGTYSTPAKTATGDLQVTAATIAGVGAYTPEPITGTGAFQSEIVTIAGVGVYTPPVKTATGALQAQETTIAGTGVYSTPDKTGTGGLVLAEVLMAGIGEYSTPPKTGTGDLQTGAATIVGTGNTIAPENVTGAGNLQPQAATIGGVGAYGTPAKIGSGSLVTATVIVTGVGLKVGLPIPGTAFERTTAVNQANGGGSDYPFLSPSADINGLFTDLYLSYEDPRCRFKYPFRLSYVFGFIGNLLDVLAAESEAIILTENGRPILLSGGPVPDNVLGPIHPREIRIVDANGEVVFDSLDAISYEETEWGDGLTVIEWISATEVCRVVYRLDSITETFYVEPADSRLDPRTSDRLPKRVQSLIVGGETIIGDVSFSAGYNIDISGAGTTRTDGHKFIDVVNLDAVPGAGLGLFPGCEDVTPILRTINQVKPAPGGNFRIEMDGCGRIQPYLTVASEPPDYLASEVDEFLLTEDDQPLMIAGDIIPDATGEGLVVSDDCHPCRECSYYVRTYRGLKRMWDRWKATAHSLEATRDLYEQNRERWLREYQCVVDHAVRVVAQTSQGCRAFIGSAFTNICAGCVAPVIFRVTLFRYKSGAEIPWDGGTPTISGASIISGNQNGPAAPEITGSVLTFTADFVGANTTALLRFRVLESCAATDVVRAHVAVFTGAADTPCTLPTGTVEAGILARWTSEGAEALPAGVVCRGTSEASTPLS